jgi:4-hydroxy-4-methyl-2-oxoglutarate aldolase
VPRARAAAVAKLAQQRIAKESDTRQRLRNGELGIDFYGLRQKLKDLGVEYREEEE